MSSKFHIRRAANIIHHNGIICYPTDSIYGLGCDPLSATAVKKILQLKGRPVEKGMIIIAGNLNQLEPYIDITETERNKILSTLPITTWLVKKSKLTPSWISGKHNTIAIRISRHPLVIELCETLHHPVVSTSVNPSSARPASTSLQCRQYFSTQIDQYLIGSPGQLSKPSTIIDIKTDQVMR